jgi:hypothetical protein
MLGDRHRDTSTVYKVASDVIGRPALERNQGQWAREQQSRMHGIPRQRPQSGMARMAKIAI